MEEPEDMTLRKENGHRKAHGKENGTEIDRKTNDKVKMKENQRELDMEETKYMELRKQNGGADRKIKLIKITQIKIGKVHRRKHRHKESRYQENIQTKNGILIDTE